MIDVRLGAFRLQIEHLSLSAGVTLLIGPNGAGKTTLLRTLAGEFHSSNARVRVHGRDLRDLGHQLAREVQLVRDSLVTVEGLHVRQLLQLCRATFGAQWSEARAESLMARLQLTRDRQLRHLSRGNAAKLRLIVAEAAAPSVLLLDEPTSGLDPFARAAFLELLAEIVRERPERVVLLSSHLLEDAAIAAPVSMLVLGEGRLVRALEPAQVEALLGSPPTAQRAALAAWFPGADAGHEP